MSYDREKDPMLRDAGYGPEPYQPAAPAAPTGAPQAEGMTEIRPGVWEGSGEPRTVDAARLSEIVAPQAKAHGPLCPIENPKCGLTLHGAMREQSRPVYPHYPTRQDLDGRETLLQFCNFWPTRGASRMRTIFLTSCGATLLITNAIFLVVLRGSIKFHGMIQLGLMVIGGVMLTFGLIRATQEGE